MSATVTCACTLFLSRGISYAFSFSRCLAPASSRVMSIISNCIVSSHISCPTFPCLNVLVYSSSHLVAITIFPLAYLVVLSSSSSGTQSRHPISTRTRPLLGRLGTPDLVQLPLASRRFLQPRSHPPRLGSTKTREECAQPSLQMDRGNLTLPASQTSTSSRGPGLHSPRKHIHLFLKHSRTHHSRRGQKGIQHGLAFSAGQKIDLPNLSAARNNDVLPLWRCKSTLP